MTPITIDKRSEHRLPAEVSHVCSGARSDSTRQVVLSRLLKGSIFNLFGVSILSWLRVDKTQSEHNKSAFIPKADIRADIDLGRFGSMLSKKASISIVMSLDVLLIIAGSGVRRH
jgi:hypothetical protein